MQKVGWLLIAVFLSLFVASSWADNYYAFDTTHRRVPDSKALYKNGTSINPARLTFTRMSDSSGVKIKWKFSSITTSGTYTGFAGYGDAGSPVQAQVQRDTKQDYLDAKVSSRATSITVLPFAGAATYETVAQDKDVHIVRGDSVSIPYSIGKDITGWTVWFGAKANPADAAYALPLREVTSKVVSPAAGTGLINLSTADTDIASKRYFAELEIRKAGDVSTALKFYLWIDSDVIR